LRTLASELGPHIATLARRPRIYADANVPAGVVSHMRDRLDWDVLSVVEDDGLRRARDVEHFRMARKLRRTLISLDDDFLDDRRFPPKDGGGVIILSAPDERGLIRLLNKINGAFFADKGHRARRPGPTPLAGQTLQVHPDWTPPTQATPRRRRRVRTRRSGAATSRSET